MVCRHAPSSRPRFPFQLRSQKNDKRLLIGNKVDIDADNHEIQRPFRHLMTEPGKILLGRREEFCLGILGMPENGLKISRRIVVMIGKG